MLPAHSRRAFTLIELLTVIAIIGILAAIIIPTVSKVRTSARYAQDGSNLRQIGMAALSYANENRNFLPPSYFAGISGAPAPLNNDSSWDMLLAPWLSTATKNTSQKRTSVIMSPLDSNAPTTGRSYSWNRNQQGSVLGAGGRDLAFRLSDFPEPTRTILVTARPTSGQIAANGSACDIDSPQRQLDADLQNDQRFNGLFNYVMVDASVKRMRADATFGTGSITAPKGYWTRAAGD